MISLYWMYSFNAFYFVSLAATAPATFSLRKLWVCLMHFQASYDDYLSLRKLLVLYDFRAGKLDSGTRQNEVGMIRFRFSESLREKPNGLHSKIDRALTGSDGVIMKSYGMEYKKLADILNEYREFYHKRPGE